MRRILQYFLITAGALAAVFGVLVGLFFLWTAQLVKVADGFLAASGAERFELASAEFQASTSEEELRAYFARSGLTAIREASWTSRTVNLGGTAELHGVAHTEDGRSVPLFVALVKEGGAWRVHGLGYPAAGLVDLEAPDRLPGAADQVALIRGSVHDLGVAVNTDDWVRYRAGLSHAWQAEKSAEGFREIFRGVKGDLTKLDRLTPELSAASTLENAVLVVSAHYDIDEGRFYARCKYLHEGVAWRLVGIQLDSKPLEP
jgi:hypothetical protein